VRSRTLLVVAVAALPLLAGCSAFGTGGGTPDGETLTPVEVTTETKLTERSDSTATRRPSTDQPGSPGETGETEGAGSASADGNRSLDRLLFARLDSVYGQRLSDTSYRVTNRIEFVAGGSDVGLVTLRRRVAADERTHVEGRPHVEEFRARGLPAPGNSSFAYVEFDNGSVRATRYGDERDSDVRYRFTVDGLATRPDLNGRARLERLLLAYDLELVSSSQDGDVFVRGERIAIPSVLSTPTPAAEIESGNLTVRIRANGTVFARAVYNVTFGDDETGYLVQTYRLDRIGDVTVRPPEWLDRAREAGEDRNAVRRSRPLP